MAKAPKAKRNGAAHSDPYAKSGTAHNIFKMKTDIGQHVLKNPGVAQAIVDKADLKQSDVQYPLPCRPSGHAFKASDLPPRSCLKSAPAREI